MEIARSERGLAALQGLYFALTGLWPLVSMESFLLVTGPKESLWLVRTVGVLILVMGATLLYSCRRRQIRSEARFLAMAAAAALLVIDGVVVAWGIASPIYLLDAVVEALFFVAWSAVIVIRRGRA